MPLFDGLSCLLFRVAIMPMTPGRMATQSVRRGTPIFIGLPTNWPRRMEYRRSAIAIAAKMPPRAIRQVRRHKMHTVTIPTSIATTGACIMRPSCLMFFGSEMRTPNVKRNATDVAITREIVFILFIFVVERCR